MGSGRHVRDSIETDGVDDSYDVDGTSVDVTVCMVVSHGVWWRRHSAGGLIAGSSVGTCVSVLPGSMATVVCNRYKVAHYVTESG